jgi:hypothetical protein
MSSLSKKLMSSQTVGLNYRCFSKSSIHLTQLTAR